MYIQNVKKKNRQFIDYGSFSKTRLLPECPKREMLNLAKKSPTRIGGSQPFHIRVLLTHIDIFHVLLESNKLFFFL